MCTTRREPSAITKNAYKGRKRRSLTGRKSQAQMSSAWLRRNVAQGWPVRRACLHHVPVLDEAHLRYVLGEYVAYFNHARPHQGLRQRVPDEDVAYFNTARPHQGLQQRIPDGTAGRSLRPEAGGTVRAVPVLGRLHHAYVRAA